MEENKKITVIVPVFNLEDKIDKCLDSLVNQTLKEIEIIVVDDGSTDRSLEKIQKYKQKKIKVISQKNSGASAARNKGIDIAKGEYITFLDGDDWIEENAYEVMYKYAKKKSLDCLICDYKEENINGDIKECFDYLIKEEYETIDKKDYLDKLFNWNEVAPAVWNKLIKREIYDKKLRFPKDIFLAEDFSITSRALIRCQRIGKLNKSFVHYVQHSNQGTRKRKENQILDLFIAHDVIKDDYKKNKVYEEYKDLIEISEIKLIYKDFFKLNLNLKNFREKEAVERFCKNLKKIRKNKEYKKIVLNRRIKCKISYCKYIWRLNVAKVLKK